ncbi:MAG: hypothetical protein AB8B87_19785 [Granulosicoccus sp.]
MKRKINYSGLIYINGAVLSTSDTGAEIAMMPMEVSGNGQFSILIHGGVESWLWQLR